jgi:hypothetical protein
MENKNKNQNQNGKAPQQGKAPQKGNFTRRETLPGQFATDFQGRIINNRCYGYKASDYSWETLFKKTPEEKVRTAKEIAKYKGLMSAYYGKDWRSRKGDKAVTNVPVRINKQTMLFELI